MQIRVVDASFRLVKFRFMTILGSEFEAFYIFLETTTSTTTATTTTATTRAYKRIFKTFIKIFRAYIWRF